MKTKTRCIKFIQMFCWSTESGKFFFLEIWKQKRIINSFSRILNSEILQNNIFTLQYFIYNVLWFGKNSGL